MKTIETVGKDIEQALKAGLAELGCKLDDVEVKILEHPGIFRKARVQMTYRGGDENVGKKTAAAVMRNLEERAARVAESGDNRQPRNGERRNDRRERTDNRPENPNGERAAQERSNNQNNGNLRQRPHNGQNNDRPNAPAQPRNNANNATAQRSERKPVEAEKPQKNEFRRDFRAELAADGAGEQRRNNERREQNDANRRRVETPREAVSPETLAAAEEKVAAYLRELTGLMGMPTEVACAIANGGLDVTLTADDENLVGTRGETLEALEHLSTLAANGGDNRQVRVNLDCGGYRARKTEELAKSAVEAADKVAATGKRIELPPMSSSGRRVVHAALGEREDVITRSEGREPNRYIVIMPKRAGDRPNGGNGNRRPNNGNFNNNRKNRPRNNQNRPNQGGKDSGAE